MLFTMNKKLPNGIFLPIELFESAVNIRIIAPTNPSIIPKILIKFILFLKIKKDNITTNIGEIIIRIELFTGVE